MLSFTDGLILHHGSYCEVKEPDLAKCAKRKDFGQGFKTGDAIECLKFVEGKKIWLKKLEKITTYPCQNANRYRHLTRIITKFGEKNK